jgi:hypothetical protein
MIIRKTLPLRHAGLQASIYFFIRMDIEEKQQMVASMAWDKVADDSDIEKTVKALASHGIEAFVVKDRNEAREMMLSLIPQGSEVHAMTSVTLEETGIAKEIEESGRYISVRKKITSISGKAEREKARRAASACQYAIGSVHALTQDGKMVIGSQSGSQLAPYAFSASNVVWVVGAQKIVENLDSAFTRLSEHCVLLEDARARKAYGMGTSLNKTLVLAKEPALGRARMIIVKEKLGF